jgi:riboflavin synthase
MFTGLIEAVGEIGEVKTTSSGARLRIRTTLAGELRSGDSVAVNGVCLTVILSEKGEIHADVGPETARITTLGDLKPSQPVNLERSMRADSRFGGHFVQGHADGTGMIEDVRSEAESRWLTISFSPHLSPYLIRKGSIAVDGISLTVAGLGERRFDVMVIPFTWEHTNLRALRIGDRVNLECDMIGKYVVRAAELAGVDLLGRSSIKAH